MSSLRGKKTAILASKKRKGAASSSGPTAEIRHPFLQIVEPTYLEFTLELCSTFHLQTVMTNFDNLGTVQFRLSGLVRQLSICQQFHISSPPPPREPSGDGDV
ncbi:hypothetical protein GOBAR_AA11556 [Gossypium barbadense]|uniref:Uncharacterized protein n=1 Tax=Gossypium barbadense TaxID=3634 RepID=A0A2P5Y0G1_GOSBA|nr:hypothetical protein GOBAR_AA11556 [Gossypium barbadense]